MLQVWSASFPNVKRKRTQVSVQCSSGALNNIARYYLGSSKPFAPPVLNFTVLSFGPNAQYNVNTLEEHR